MKIILKVLGVLVVLFIAREVFFLVLTGIEIRNQNNASNNFKAMAEESVKRIPIDTNAKVPEKIFQLGIATPKEIGNSDYENPVYDFMLKKLITEGKGNWYLYDTTAGRYGETKIALYYTKDQNKILIDSVKFIGYLGIDENDNFYILSLKDFGGTRLFSLNGTVVKRIISKDIRLNVCSFFGMQERCNKTILELN
jgi:hypothetical protein